jgi:hypothetical protein
MRWLALIALGGSFGVAACGNSEDAGEASGKHTPLPTTNPAKSPPLAPTLRKLGTGSPDVFCDRLTVRFLIENYMKPAPLALKTCNQEASRNIEVAPKDIELDVIKRQPGRAIIALSAFGNLISYMALISDGRRWLIDGIASSTKELPRPRRPVLAGGVSADQLESFILEQHESAVRVVCSEVKHQDLGEWTCDMTHVFRNRGPSKGSAVVTVAPSGTVFAQGFGAGSSIDACCIELAPD